jgi:hypothetical protein
LSDAPEEQAVLSFASRESDAPPLPAAAPPPAIVFTPVEDRYGARLALVFGNQAPGGVCPYYAAACCHHCDIGAGEGARFDHTTNVRRLAWFREHYAGVRNQVAHLVVYNSGSVLNPREMPTEVLDAILFFARSIPALRVVSLDSREPFITSKTLLRIAETLGFGRSVRPIIGLETANDQIRDELLQKQMPRRSVLRAFEAVGTVAAWLGADRVGLDVNIVVAGPGTTPGRAVADALETARFAFEAGREHGVSVDLNLHPYYPGARGRARFPDHPRCPLPVLARTVAALCELRAELTPSAALFIGWEDEGHDLEPDRRAMELDLARGAFERFNRSQNPGALDTLSEDADPGDRGIAQA